MVFKKHKGLWRLISIIVIAFSFLVGCSNNLEFILETENSGTDVAVQTSQSEIATPTEESLTAQETDTSYEESTTLSITHTPTVGPTPTEVPEPESAPAEETTPDTETYSAEVVIAESGEYTSKDDVALYIHLYSKLPENFITKKDAQALGWSGGSLEPYAPGKSIGGDRFGNYEGVLPDGKYKECDIDTKGKKSRGAKRIVFDDKGNIYYTDDHYETFTQLY